MRVGFTQRLLTQFTWEPDEMNSRRLTISCRYPEVRARQGEHARSVPMPFLRLQGRWLDQAGFPIGAQVQVQVNQGRLVLEVIGAAGSSSAAERTDSTSDGCTATSPAAGHQNKSTLVKSYSGPAPLDRICQEDK